MDGADDTMKEKTMVEVDDERLGLGLIDVASEDDCLISFSGSQNDSEFFEFSEDLNAQEKEDAETFSREKEQEPMLFESLEPEGMRKSGKCDLRKSLTWDSAFVTGDGVLNPEELSILNCGFKKAEKHPLPAIQENMRGSIDSTSTLDSDNLSLESLEVDLFADIRASIQRSSKETKSACSSSKILAVKNLRPSKKMDLTSQNKTKPVFVSKRQSISMQGRDNTKKEAIIRPQIVQATPKSREPKTSSLRPPKIVGRANLVSAASMPLSAASTKRTSLGGNRVKIDTNSAKAATGKVGPNMVSKKAGLGDSRVTPRATPPSPSSSVSSFSVTKIESATSCSSLDGSGSTSSESVGKVPVKPLRNKTTSRNFSPALGSTIKTPSKNRTEPANSRLAMYLKSVSKPISPASSIDAWSSESSSSTSTVNQRSNSSKTSLDSPCKGFYSERDAAQIPDLQNHQHDQPFSGDETKKSPSQYPKGTPKADAPSHTPIDASRKPSGLRMPSPKIGFFDVEKSAVRTPNSSLQFHPGARSGIPKHTSGGTSLHERAVKANLGKDQPARTGSKNCDPHSTGVSRSPLLSTKRTSQLRELSRASPKVFPTPRSREKSPGNGIASKDQNDTKTDKISLVSLPNEVVIQNDGLVPESKKLFLNTDEDVPQQFTKASSGEETVNGENHVESNLSTLGKINEKENSLCVGNQVDRLTSHMETVDLNNEGLNSVNPGDPNSVSVKSRIALFHGQKDFVKDSSECSPLTLFSNGMDIVPPLEAKLSSSNAAEFFGSALEPMVGTASTFPFSESMQTDSS